MKFQFDPDQEFQLDAVAAVTDLFDGQPEGAPEYSVVKLGEFDGMFAGQERSTLGLGNQILLADEALRENLRRVQARNDIEIADPKRAPEAWELEDACSGQVRSCPHFSVEMETGTGKTYVYLRTIFELSRRYGFRKFVIVVPSVAIREGVLKSIEITAEHFRALYDNPAVEHFVYDSKHANRLRHFATSSALQVMVINIDAFRKNFTGSDDERKSAVIYKESDRLGRAPIEFAQAARPIVIIDEPQSVDSTEKAQEAIKALNPLCTLRYSATHRDPYNLVYQLGPVRAFELKLVKQIVVTSATSHGDANDAFVRVERVDYKPAIKAKLRIHAQTKSGTKEKSVTVKQGSDLLPLSGDRACYRDGFEVVEISAEPGAERLRFANGRTLRLGEELGGLRDDVWRVQIRTTVQKHLEKELAVRGRGIKVLSLFFIDRVANYREYAADGTPVPGKFAMTFEEILKEFARDPRYSELEWLQGPADLVHDGYFASDRKGLFKDSRGNTQADDEVYNLIMKNKEALLALDEPLRFLFSHSALREGWDNPNVFQICTLNETRSTVKKRQEIGRGLRLPVDQSGARVFDETVNRLSVMANESYEDFARALQTEYEDECGVTFGKLPTTAFAKLTRVIDGEQRAIGNEAGESVRAALVDQGMLDAEGRIQPAFDPQRDGFSIRLPDDLQELEATVIDLLAGYQIERHIKRDKHQVRNTLRKEVTLQPEFQALWEQIKPRTTYRVEFDSKDLVRRAIDQIGKMPEVREPRVRVSTGQVVLRKGGVTTRALTISEELARSRSRGLPDLLAHLQNNTELTRSTLVEILNHCGRLHEVFVNPQMFLDQVSRILEHELHRALVDGIKYERLPASDLEPEWEMVRFENDELIDYLRALRVESSVYDYVVYDSEVERRFAQSLDQRTDIKLFVKLPAWFKIDTPVGTYNPDWAIVKHDGQALYLVRETKSTRDFMKLRTAESDKVRCGMRHFESLGVPFDVVTRADEV